MSAARMYVGEIVGTSEVGHCRRYRVTAYLADGCLYLERKLADGSEDQDCPITLVTREGLLRLAKGPFEVGFVEDHL